ncbi:AraC family transcriptional regulator [Shewanella youngdeokensis]|uniref:AraC family transcriptional regulator n=1 Tax=Shewanella youngdeokensis TaxID=2999068 RepID=A0ABZ0K4I7_9GAMM|nr:AraC family transcriptional regulator [Shewanella sp. DAU334]
MSKAKLKQLIERRINNSGMIETGIEGVQIFKITDPISCAPAVYEPSITAIVCGGKEAILEGDKHTYSSNRYICCPMSIPIEAGTPDSSPANPLIGAYISLDTQLMTELSLQIDSSINSIHARKNASGTPALQTASWSEEFCDALYRLLLLSENPADSAILAKSRLRELYYAVLKGEAGYAFRRAFGVGNDMARAIEQLSSNLTEAVTIEDMASKLGMSRAVFHRKFKHATNMSPIQFVKSMRLNSAAMKVAEGVNVNVAAMEVGYTSSSQFSREFKRMFGKSPKQWRQEKAMLTNTI